MRMGNLLTPNLVWSHVSATRSTFRMAHPTVVPTNYDPAESASQDSESIDEDAAI
jgi:hypothetical protein